VKYDWKACAISMVAGLAVAAPAGLGVTPVAGSTLLLTAVVTVVGGVVTTWVYARVARPGARPVEIE
jgi:hypothetical protein